MAEAKGEVEAATEELTKAREESESAPTPDKKNRKKGNIEEWVNIAFEVAKSE